MPVGGGRLDDDVALRDQVHRALTTLREADREVLITGIWFDLSPAEAAKVLGVSRPTRAAETSLAFFQLLAAAPATAADRAAWQADGSPARWTDGGVAVEGAAGPRTRRALDDPNRSRTYPLGGTSLTAAQLEARPR
ncbi:hypothetical protein M1L60_33905 [Actinoplanes sp. TRM 88003]|uniref:RNA polymerase sigma factor 70 region 4 type 2 domain-containing protein n=1 Tax=Paractinoplanes aksuensis TaxID=2939490 RepID=A0ABT1E181_9ACTN|nr:hypothetical protein [Actinoplanes aksuensis]MCO8275591.1 hypothetical protein [Actinoplanes aksuensis]